MPTVRTTDKAGAAVFHEIALTRLQYQILVALQQGAALRGEKPAQANGEPNPAQPYQYSVIYAAKDVEPEPVTEVMLQRLCELGSVTGHVDGRGLSPRLRYELTDKGRLQIREAQPFYDKSKRSKGAE